MNLLDFKNRLRSLHCIDKYVLDEALVASGEESLDEETWIRFRDEPARFLMGTDKLTSLAIWKCVEDRQ